jgi:DNA anti-recombination protein RmuC
MGLDAVVGAKVPAWPKEIDDKNLAGEFKDFQKAVTEIQKATEDFQKKVNNILVRVNDFPLSCVKKLKDKNLDPKQSKALETLTSAASDIKQKFIKNIMF